MRREAIHVVTAAEAQSQAYSARRVVLPLPGSDILMPRTAEGTLYAAMLRFDGVDPYTVALECAALRRDGGGCRGGRGGDRGAAAAASGCGEEAEGEWEEEEKWEEEAEEWQEEWGEQEAWEEEAWEEEAWEGHKEKQEEGSNWFELQGDYRALLLRPRGIKWRTHLPPGGTEAGADAEVKAAAAADAVAVEETDVELQLDLPPGAYATMALREVSKERPPASRQRHIRFS